jgi:FtsP/CotA-like multicopper oxidase with cupredoxin domain
MLFDRIRHRPSQVDRACRRPDARPGQPSWRHDGRKTAMSTTVSRRGFLGAALATGVLPVLPVSANAAFPTPKPLVRLVAGTRTLEVNGRPAKVFSLTGPDGRPGIRLAPGERFRVELANETGVRTLVHWHGQLPPWTQDGFPWPQTPPIENGVVQAYDYAPIAGTYWMHSHHELQEQRLMTAPLIVHDKAVLREDRQEVVLMLHDFTFREPDEVLAGLVGASAATAQAIAQNDEQGGEREGSRTLSQPGAGGMADMGATTCRICQRRRTLCPRRATCRWV